MEKERIKQIISSIIIFLITISIIILIAFLILNEMGESMNKNYEYICMNLNNGSLHPKLIYSQNMDVYCVTNEGLKDITIRKLIV